MKQLAGTELGLTYGKGRLADSQPGWADAFERLAAEVWSALRGRAVGVEHVGSTAVPGLVSKPILDLAVGLEDRPAHRVAHVHVVSYGDERWLRYLKFRDHLRADSETRAAYAALKRRLAARFPDDRPAYTAAKASFIAEVFREAGCKRAVQARR